MRPILAIHGYQDNAGSFDRLIPKLPTHLSYLAIDLPGHGLSSRLPNGVMYSSMNDILILHHIIKYFKWEKVSFLAHSMGSIICFIYAASYPDRVDMVIALDNLMPNEFTSNFINTLLPCIEETFKADEEFQMNLEPPANTYSELIEKLASNPDALLTMETVLTLLKRGVCPSKTNPNKYYFNWDGRLRSYYIATYTLNVCLNMAKLITCPYLFLNPLKWSNGNSKEYNDEIMATMKSSSVFDYYEVDGKSYLHLAEPELVGEICSKFINKYRPFIAVAKI